MSENLIYSGPLGEQPEASPKIVLPALRTFVVRRWNNWKDTDGESMFVEEVTIEAHLSHITDGVLGFSVYYLDPQMGPVQQIRQMFNEWIDMEEIVFATPTIIH